MELKALLNNRILSGSGNPAFIHGEVQMGAQEFRGLTGSIIETFNRNSFKKGDRVVIITPKSIPVIAAVFGCMLAGLVFVPVDPQTPAERLKFIIRDCSPSGILVDRDGLERLGEAFFEGLGGIRLLSFEEMETCLPLQVIPCCGGTAPEDGFREPCGEDTAYIIYTSGSTGTPKGVAVSRDALASFIRASVEKASYTPDTRFLNFFPLHFDPVLMEIIMPWVVGGTTVVFGKFLYINDMVKALQKYRISDFSCTPNIISMLVGRLSHYPKHDWSFLRSIWFGGESANITDLKRFREITPHVRLFNGYGPTETVVACSLHEVEDGDLEEDILPIGTPMRDVDFRIVLEDRVVDRDDVTGELLVGGKQLMQGYWGKTDRPEESGFVLLEGRRYYKTGDNVYRKNGSYYFVGRRNSMIKLRGYRIFPVEIENALNSMEEVSNACVFLDKEAEALVGVIELKGPCEDREGLREKITDSLRCRLPSYMIPEKMVFEDRLPRLSNGKLDLRRIKEISGVCDG